MKKVFRKWIAALRGGHWTQIRGSFYGKDEERVRERCAVGVLIEVAPGANRDEREQWVNHNVDCLFRGRVVARNDKFNMSFSEIADWLEKGVLEDDN